MKRLRPFVASRGRFLVRLSVLGVFLVSVAHGQVSFFTPPTYSAGGQDFVADYNGDGKPDILSGSIMNLGNGDGTFTKGTPVTGTPLAVADFNGDGKPDVLEQGQGTLEVLLGNGDGTFQTTPIITNIEASLRWVIAGDLRGDGKSDVLGFSNNSLIVYLGNGDGTFAAGVSYPVVIPFGPVVITLGDFNGDQKLDVVVSVPGNNGIVPGQEVVFLGNGDGTFQAGRISTGVPDPASAVVGDFNGDGKLDLVISNQILGCNSPCPTSILLGNGDGTFQTPTAIFPGTGSLAVGDVNGDGKLDLVFLDESEDVEVYLGNGDGTFSNTHSYQSQIPSGNDGPVLADFNLDGKLDIAAAGTSLLGNGNGTFKGWSAVAGVGPLSISNLSQIAIGDFEKNGRQDLAAGDHLNPNNLYIFTNDGIGALSLAHTYLVQQPVVGISTADFNGDGNLDLIAVSQDPIYGTWGYSVLLGKGDGSFQSPVFYSQNVLGVGPTIVIADFNNDHKLDFAVPAGNETFAVLLGNGDGTFGAPTYVFDGNSNNQPASTLVAADFNGDGKIDIAASGYFNSGGMAILLGKGDGTFQTATFPFTDTLGSLFTADLNLDGKADLVDSFSHAYLGNGDGTFKEITAPGYFVSALADINGDGVPDEIGDQSISNHRFAMGVALGNGDGTFGSFEAVFYDYQQLYPALAADMNGDGKQDLIVVGNTIFVLINTTVSVPGVSFSPAAVTFPAQTVGTGSGPVPVTLTNTGAVALTVTSVTIGGVDAGEFSQTNNCTKVEPLATCTIRVQFMPTAVGGSVANLMVADNAAGSPQKVALSGTGMAAADFAIGPASGSPSSATVTAGQMASFNLAITPSGSFSGTVNLTCAVTPVVTPAPVCKVPASVNVTASTTASATATVSTTASMTARAMASANFPSGGSFIGGMLAMLVSGLLFVGCRRRIQALAVPLIAVAFLTLPGCGGGGSSPTTTPGTPAGSYTATVTASAGNLKHTTALTVIVQ